MHTEGHQIAEFAYELSLTDKPKNVIVESIAEKINILVARAIQAHINAEQFRDSGSIVQMQTVSMPSGIPKVQVMPTNYNILQRVKNDSIR